MRNQQIYQEASEWFVHMRDGNDAPGVRGELMEWLRRSPEHVRAYLDIAAVWMESRRAQVDCDVDLDARIVAAKADKSVAELAPRFAARKERYLGRRGRLALAASVALLLAGAATLWWQFTGNTYSTSLGEQRSIALRDGSTITLNSQSRVRVRLDDERRTIELLSGQALFSVAKDAARPFIVRTDDTEVRAVGTVFEVYRKQGGAVVTVVEGAVDVAHETPADTIQAPKAGVDPHAADLSLRLKAGEQVVIGLRAMPLPKAVNVSAATAWTRRELVFEFTPLGEAAEEFNRYNEKQLIVEGDELRAFKISAVFRSTDSGSLVRYLRGMPGVSLRETGDTIIIAAQQQ